MNVKVRALDTWKSSDLETVWLGSASMSIGLRARDWSQFLSQKGHADSQRQVLQRHWQPRVRDPAEPAAALLPICQRTHPRDGDGEGPAPAATYQAAALVVPQSKGAGVGLYCSAPIVAKHLHAIPAVALQSAEAVWNQM